LPLYEEAKLSFGSPGKVEMIFVQVGDVVKKGDQIGDRRFR